MSFSTMAQDNPTSLPPSLSGIYSSLAYVNDEGECGAGAVVPWADRLWIVTPNNTYSNVPDARR